ncbi:hypothetical protein C8K36_104180 [Rhodococcus sp. OK519]|nr:hypothetical protein C8K36_104180 [Rhodococcus sp. OK519]
MPKISQVLASAMTQEPSFWTKVTGTGAPPCGPAICVVATTVSPSTATSPTVAVSG